MSNPKNDLTQAAYVGKMTGANVAYKMWLAALPLHDGMITLPVDESCRACYARHFPQGEEPYEEFSRAFHATAYSIITGLQEGGLDPWDVYSFFADNANHFDLAGIPEPPAQFPRPAKGEKEAQP